jgi:hypothetical protein
VLKHLRLLGLKSWYQLVMVLAKALVSVKPSGSVKP